MELISKDGYGIFERENFVFYSTGENFYEYNFIEITEITKEYYLEKKYGKENQFWKQPFDEFIKLKSENFITTFYQEDEMRLHKKNGEIVKKFEKIRSPHRMGIYGMAIDKNENLWIAVPVEHFVGKFNIETEREIFSISGKELEPTIFDHPEYVTAINDFIYVSDMGNRRIVKINIHNHKITDYKKLNERIYYFNQVNGKNIYQLESGIYFE